MPEHKESKRTEPQLPPMTYISREFRLPRIRLAAKLSGNIVEVIPHPDGKYRFPEKGALYSLPPGFIEVRISPNGGRFISEDYRGFWHQIESLPNKLGEVKESKTRFPHKLK